MATLWPKWFGEIVRWLVVVRPHVMHELAIHAKDHKHLQLVVGEERVALRQHVARTPKDALAVGLRVKGGKTIQRLERKLS